MKTTDDKSLRAILVKENGLTFVKHVDDNGDEAEADMDVDINEILQEVRNERIDKIIASLQLPNASSQI